MFVLNLIQLLGFITKFFRQTDESKAHFRKEKQYDLDYCGTSFVYPSKSIFSRLSKFLYCLESEQLHLPFTQHLQQALQCLFLFFFFFFVRANTPKHNPTAFLSLNFFQRVATVTLLKKREMQQLLQQFQTFFSIKIIPD